MWRRLTHHLRTIALVRSNPKPVRFVVASSTVPTNIRRSAVFVSRHFSTASGATIIVDDLMPIATGHEREELQAALTEEPAVVKSYYDKRIVGCPGVEGEHEHDVVWFWLEKGKPHECPVCSQYFVLEVVGPGGPLDDHGDDHHHKRPTLLNILVLELMV
ncbi:cytochrome c oxidase subunit 5b-2, mitochondrial-like isoform X2 [Primulina eburnea]|uniref:cytochrome c oxidase subunit 5b-2, mitochondrial-like isoform X2 n=1 Tax=Primulina eburnea TaxID=1245227 RepID=UPI003C6CAF82